MLVLGHRGAASADAPENTLLAVERALRLGADGVEVDLRLTADGVPVCLHDADLRRVHGDPRPVSRVALADLPPSVPALGDVLDLVGDRGRVVLELKGFGLLRRSSGLVDSVEAELRRHRLPDVVVSSFAWGLVADVRRRGLPVRTPLLGRPGASADLVVRQAERHGHHQVHLHRSSLGQVSPDRVGVTAWTVDEPEDLRRLEALGVEAVISDRPHAARAALHPALPSRPAGR